MMVNELKQLLVRGAKVQIGDGYGDPALRSKTMVVASKTTVPCKGSAGVNRCRGPWCVGLAVFLTSPESYNDDKKLAWRRNTVKVCLTHLKDENGALLVPPPLRHSHVEEQPLTRLAAEVESAHKTSGADVTWSDLAAAHQAGDLNRLAIYARLLKQDNENLRQKTLALQEKVIDHLTA